MAARDKAAESSKDIINCLSVYNLSLLAFAGNSTEISQEDRKHYTSS